MKLFESDDEDIEKLSKIQVNEEFARRFEHNKKREDLQRFEELKKKGLVDEDESSEGSEDEDDINEFGKSVSKKDAKFFDALIKIRKKDPVLQNKEAKLFESESESESDSEADVETEAGAKKRPMYLKDVVSKHLIEEGPEFVDEDEHGDKDKGEKKVKTYLEEQEELRKEFFDAVAKEEMETEQDGDEIIKIKERRNGGDEDDEDDDGEFSKKLEEYFGKDDKLDENDRYLKDFFRNKMWLHKDDKGGKVEDDKELILSEDEEALEKQEDYEREFNFRFEENAGDRVLGHSRKMEGSVRKKSNARKSQRERKEERIAREKEERKEELKRLKNLKKKEMHEKLQMIKETAGIKGDVACLLDGVDLEGEFNPEQYDSKMNETFGDAYYDDDDANPNFGSEEDDEKPDFDKEDEILGLPAGWDKVNQQNGFLSAREKILKRGVACDNEDEDWGPMRNTAAMQAAKEQLMDEYYKLDYEDVIDDLKTRFKYKPVKPKKFGLKAEEILILDDKELNQYVPLKTLAPYRETEWKVPHIKRYQQKQKVRELMLEVSQKQNGGRHEKNKKKPREMETSKAETSTENGGDDTSSNLSRKKRRKLRQAELKISHQRLLAYGKK
ncbi:hypothetical protein DM860_011505 [Cuscuta australis]|uniref:Kri1-like C-terminal domain-containing protein n=1 Tax=Cuscuta australis TaxID=267555 RepID=A0A328D3S6_9ASTE|nr:hypothetical protein DM860_011505 [Cuscuta australis]